MLPPGVKKWLNEPHTDIDTDVIARLQAQLNVIEAQNYIELFNRMEDDQGEDERESEHPGPR